ncbi:ABC transporter permease [uncultured Paracoccus sp.]|uniref:ABC transporter permease n=1 Tax=uncultured Paracoccus sp. TaxID=189685 RepID=UPI002626DEFE|nr:ABC transporter permease [uncultured Paracoccus sp.]
MATRPKPPAVDGARAALLTPALLIVTLGALAPVLVIALYSILTPGDYGGVSWTVSFQNWLNVIAERDFLTDEMTLAAAHLEIFWRSVKLAFLTTLLTFIFGFPAAYFIATRPPHRRDLWLMLIMLPFWTNLLIRIFAVMQLIRNDGIINNLLLSIGAIEAPIQMLYTEFAVLVGMTYLYLPLMVLPIYASMERFDFSLAEAGYDLYAPRLRVLQQVILPAIKPGIIAGSILVFIPSLGDYVVARVLGGGKQLMLGNLIGMQFGELRNWPLGAALSLTLLAIVAVAMVIYVRTAGAEEEPHG